jgi:predicted nuclease of predicted toxin-antitoxin system
VRVLLDGCVPRRLADELPDYEVKTAPEMGWANLDDGPLLDAMAERFDVLVTVDKSLPKQQRIENRPLAVVVLRAKTNRLADLLTHVPKLRTVVENAQPGQVYEISG